MSIILNESRDFCTSDRARVLPVFIGASVRVILAGKSIGPAGVDSCQGYNAVAHGTCHDPDPMPSGLATTSIEVHAGSFGSCV